MKFWQANELLAVLTEARKVSVRNHLIVLLAYKHGLRVSELCALRLQDVQHGRVDVKRLKGSLHTNRPMESDDNVLLDERRALSAYLRERGPSDSDALFISRLGKRMTRWAIRDIFEDAAMRAHIEPGRRNPHMAKHTLGALAYRAGVDVVALQQLLGHRDPKATLAYTHLSQDEAHLKAKSAMAAVFAPA